MSDEARTHSTCHDSSSTIYQSSPSYQKSISEEEDKDASFEQKLLSLVDDHRQNLKITGTSILKLSKDTKNVSREVKNACKVLHFPPEWCFEEVLATVDELNPQEYPNLFIFVIELKTFKFQKQPTAENESIKKQLSSKVKKIKKVMRKFGSTRPLLLQFTSEEDNVTKFRYKEEGSAEFVALDHDHGDFWEVRDFPSFLCDFLAGNFEYLEDFEGKLNEALPNVHRTLLLLRFWSALNLTDASFKSIILEVSKTGTKSEFLAALDAPFEDNMGLLRNRAEQYLPYYLTSYEDSEDHQNSTSVLLTAVENQNKDIIDYLITFWTHLIQQLPFEHQVKISTAAYMTNQLDVLCDLLDIADFPFPKDFKIDNVHEHKKLNIIARDRSTFADAIIEENYEDINLFIDSNPSLRIAYNLVNKSASQQAVDIKHYKVYSYLKSFGFTASEFDDLEDVLTNDEIKVATQAMVLQRRKNINGALTEDQKSVNLLCNKSFIHNRRIDKEQEKECRKKIRKWYEDIKKIEFGDLLLDVVASCDDLIIIFDFQSQMVESASMSGADAHGSMYPTWIFIGAKLTDEGNNPREQQIKGVLAHELCHYVMMLVYENQENPYYKVMPENAKMFEEIVKALGGSQEPDDECNGIISLVFRLYEVKDFHPELIVRVVHIMTEFDDDEDKTKYLKDKFKILFDFWEQQVIPDLRAFNLKSRESVRKMNRMLELLEFLETELYSFNAPKDIKQLFDHELTIVTSNVPTLLLNEIYNYLEDTVGDLFDTQCVFVVPQVLQNQEILVDFTKLLEDNPALNAVIDCSSEVPKNIKKLKGSKTICVVSSEAQHDELVKYINKHEEPPTKLEMNYIWNDLTVESQELLLDHEVCFQNWTGVSLLQLLMPTKSFEAPESSKIHKKAKNQVLQGIPEIIDDELLNLLVDGSDIFINTPPEDVNTKNQRTKQSIDILFIEREFIKKTKKPIKFEAAQPVKFGMAVNREGHVSMIPNISQQQLLYDVNDKPVVLISDIAGNGKSWAMKNFADIFRGDESVKWVTYVDLKQFIDEFKAQHGEIEFSAFLAERILKPQQPFEYKIFQKMYKTGKASILFDGFDEIAPDCAECVSKLAQKFQQNGGNQLWISTRDYFEVDLQVKLNTDAVYRLREINLGEATTLIAQSWVLLENDINFESDNEFINCLSSLGEMYSSYLQKAHQIVQKLFFKWFSSVGMPQLLKMVAECYKNDKDGVDLNLSMIFDKFMLGQYEKWSDEKGQLRKTANIQSQRFSLNFWRMHQYFAIAALFPEFLEILFPGCDGSEWPIEEIIACGLMTKFGDKIFFIHETYGEFFVADLVARELKRPKIGEEILEILVKILTNRKHVVIRGFLNGLLDSSDLMKIQHLTNNVIDCFDETSNYKFHDFLIEIFKENHEKFASFAMELIKCEAYKKKRKIIRKSAASIASSMSNNKSFNAFQDFIETNLTTEDLKELIIYQGIIPGILRSSLEIEVLENFLNKIEPKVSKAIIRKALMSYGAFGDEEGNNIHHLFRSSKFDHLSFQRFLRICQKYLNFDEICSLFRHCNQKKQSVLILWSMAQSSRHIKHFWEDIEQLYALNRSSQGFKELVKHEDYQGFNVLDYSCSNADLNFHEEFWKVLLNTFKNREEMKELILKIDKLNKDNYIHKLVAQSSNNASIVPILEVLKQNFTDDQFSEMLRSKGRWSINLLKTAAIFLRDVDHHRNLWKLFRGTCSSDEEFLKILKEVDDNRKNILQYCSQFSSNDVLEFVIEELEKIATHAEMKEMLSLLDSNGYSMFHCCALQNRSPDLHLSVWKVMKKYFNRSELVSFVHQTDVLNGGNLLFFALICNNLQILELTWTEIKKCLTYDEQIGYLKSTNKNGISWLDVTRSIKKTDENISKDKVEWVINLFKEYGFEV